MSRYKDGRITNTILKEEGGSISAIQSLAEDNDGRLWIGVVHELFVLKDGKFFTFNTENGLFNNDVFAIIEDKRGNFWISSNQGIYRVSKQQLNDFADGKSNHYDSMAYGNANGMLSTECNDGSAPSAIIYDEGQIWFPTLEGISVVNPESLQINLLPPPVEIENIEIDREKTSFKNKEIMNNE